MHTFTRHMLASQCEDDDFESERRDNEDADEDDEDENDDDDDDDGGSSQRKSAKKKFADLQRQLLGSSHDASAVQPTPQADAVNMEELTGGLIDESVRYWTDFQQVTRHLRALMVFGLKRSRDLLRAERIPREIVLPIEHRPWPQ